MSISLCENCHCMTKTVDGFCGKCNGNKKGLPRECNHPGMSCVEAHLDDEMKIVSLLDECNEQARLNGAGASREARLLAKVEELNKANVILAQNALDRSFKVSELEKKIEIAREALGYARKKLPEFGFSEIENNILGRIKKALAAMKEKA